VTAQYPELFLETALDALSSAPDWRAVLDELPVPIYTTDPEGAVTYWNRACIALAGRVPQLGQDRWCVSWQIYTTDPEGAVTYWNRACIALAGRVPQLGQDRWCVSWQIYTTDGDRIPHDQCPMAEAIRQRQEVRDKVAIALRPDGSRVAFRPYPTPLFDAEGKFTGAVNMLVDVSDEQVEALNAQAEKCRRLAGATYNREMSQILADMAEGYQRAAVGLSRKPA